ncbi:MAG: amino acid ABC transporter permease [Candidatus Methylacidiphilales bacterium]|nr:amino acid ABC transporter permease [Candidatus Methylacidiphilales bacterium]
MDSIRHWFLAPRDPAESIPFSAKVANVLLVLTGVAIVFILAFRAQEISLNWAAIQDYWWLFASALGNTLIISVGTLLLSLPIGVLGALSQRSYFLPLRYGAKTYVELIRGTPLIAQILLFYYVLGSAVRLDNAFIAGIIILSIFNGAYITEIIRGGIDTVGQTQMESARAIGLTTFQAYRYVILPQALRHSLPSLAGQFVSMVKDSSLLSTIAVAEFTFQCRQAANITYSTFECFFVMTVGYLIITLPLSALARWLERRMVYET